MARWQRGTASEDCRLAVAGGSMPSQEATSPRPSPAVTTVLVQPSGNERIPIFSFFFPLRRRTYFAAHFVFLINRNAQHGSVGICWWYTYDFSYLLIRKALHTTTNNIRARHNYYDAGVWVNYNQIPHYKLIPLYLNFLSLVLKCEWLLLSFTLYFVNQHLYACSVRTLRRHTRINIIFYLNQKISTGMSWKKELDPLFYSSLTRPTLASGMILCMTATYVQLPLVLGLGDHDPSVG